jgi:hypothetical protein
MKRDQWNCLVLCVCVCVCLCIRPTPYCMCICCSGDVLPNRCWKNTVPSICTIPAFKCHVSLHWKVAERNVFCVLHVVSNTQYVLKGK